MTIGGDVNTSKSVPSRDPAVIIELLLLESRERCLMFRITIALCAAFAGVIDQAIAQSAYIDHTVTWTEVNALTGVPVANPNGVIDPGEGALIRVSVSFTPVGQYVSYFGGTAPVAGYRSSVFKLEAMNAGGGQWAHLAAPPGFSVEFLPPPVGLNGTLGAASSYQFSQPSPWMPNPSNPFEDVWQGVWIPPSYEARQVSFEMRPLVPIVSPPVPCYLWVFDGTIYRAAIAEPTWDSVQFPVVPAPGVLVTLIGGTMLAARRRR